MARWSADNALRALETFTDDQVLQRDSLMAASALYAGFSLAHLGMAMCSAAIDEGPEITNQQLFAEAENRFGRALTLSQQAGIDHYTHAANVGLARVRLFQGNTAGAATAAALVPEGFLLETSASAAEARRYNRVFHSNVQARNYTVEAQSRNLMTEGVEDPRSATVESGLRTSDGQIGWIQMKFTGYDSPVPIARYEEAQLILAEAEGGQTAVDIIDDLRAAHGLPAYTGPTDAASIRNLIIEERRRELFVEGFRMHDIHRFQVPLVPAPGTEYPVKGGSYGNTTCLPLPDVERFNNPSISG